MKRTERERRADELLCAARHWQFNEERSSESMNVDTDAIVYLIGDLGTEDHMTWPDFWASAALSEVAWHQGHDLVNADGTDVEKVTSFEVAGGVVGEDAERVFYRRARR